MLKDTEVSYPDGFTIRVEIGVNDMLECEWGYVLTFRRSDLGDRKLVGSLLREKGVNPDSAIVIIPSRQSFSLSFNPRGEIDGSSQLLNSSEFLTKEVRAAATQRILFLPHAVRQMSRPDRMITTAEVRYVVENGTVIESYLDDPRGASCLMLGYGEEGRAIHVVCSPKPDFLAIITAYLPDSDEWSADYSARTK